MHLKKIVVAVSIISTTTLLAPTTKAQTPGSFILQPSKDTLVAGDNLLLTIELSTGGENVNSYIANLTYPEDKFTFESINTDGSPFTMALEAKGGNGEINIIRGTTKAVTGKELVGKASFKAKTNTSANEIKITSKSAIISSNNQNILPNSSVQNTTSPTTTTQPPSEESPATNFLSQILNNIVSFFSSFFKK